MGRVCVRILLAGVLRIRSSYPSGTGDSTSERLVHIDLAVAPAQMSNLIAVSNHASSPFSNGISLIANCTAKGGSMSPSLPISLRRQQPPRTLCLCKSETLPPVY